MTVFALLDDHQSPADAPRSRLYEDWVREYRCAGQSPAEAAGEWRAQWPRIAADLAAGLHGVLLADYEWGVALAGLTPPADARPSLRVLLFRHCRHLSAAQVETWLAARHPRADTPPVAGLMDAEADESAAAFAERIEAIQAAIRRGETYQVNHTFRLNFQAYGDPIALYRRLRARQPVPYGALIALPPTPGSNGPDHVLSLSPELFLRHDPAAGRLITRPMKGTLARSGDPAADNRRAKALAADPKNRAENLMIVDLLRNDLGRVAQSGSVRVDELFGVEAYGPVLQMSSTISAEPRPGLDFPALLAALFPCGSITGAPKHRTMSLIGRGEPTPRGLYTGAIGWLDGADGASAQLPAFCLSVAIRTLVLQAPPAGPQSPRYPGTLGLGAGITLDSRSADEYAECLLKGRFATACDPGFELFETLRAENGQIHRLDAHLARLAHSARRLGFAFDEAAARAQLSAVPYPLTPAGSAPAPLRLRLALAHDGGLSLRHAPLPPLAPSGREDDPVGLCLADDDLSVWESHYGIEPALYGFKTSRRGHYDEGVRQAEAKGAFDTLFHRGGWLTEGGRSTLFLRLDGRWYTPPLNATAAAACANLLPGVMRAAVLADPRWQARERPLHLNDLARAEALMVCNALRGCLMATLSPHRTALPLPPPSGGSAA